jgi:thymidylate kinase
MFSIALIGADGTGKTTIARRLEHSFPLPVKYLYMGHNADSTNVSLPTSRLVETFKRRQQRRSASNVQAKGQIWATLRMLNQFAEESYRQLLSWYYRKQGWLVVYDRYYRFDFEYDSQRHRQRPFADRFHRWCLARFYPLPDIVIYLDAPPEVLLARKGEGTLNWLVDRQRCFLEQEHTTEHFIRIDATQPLDSVYREVEENILSYFRERTRIAPAA